MLGCGQQTKSPEAPKEVKQESKQSASGLQEKKDKKEEAPEEVGYLRPAWDWTVAHWKPIAIITATTIAVFIFALCDYKYNLHGRAWNGIKAWRAKPEPAKSTHTSEHGSQDTENHKDDDKDKSGEEKI
ncbi:MAG: hypothetical protein LE169_04350 [Endomicrobium sp.]|nr:hypothetical protein [Endomicrobium sp.]